MKKTFIGIDIQVRRDCCYAVINNESTLIDSGWFSNADTDLLNFIKKLTKSGEVEIGIDAPRMPLISKRQWYWNKNRRRWDKQG